MAASDDELDRFKRLPLAQLAAELFDGRVVARKSSKTCVVMDLPGDRRVVIGKSASTGHELFWEVFSDAGGSVIDLIQMMRPGISLGRCRVLLREHDPSGVWTTRPIPTTEGREAAVGDLVPVEKDVVACVARYEAMRPLRVPHTYLCGERGVPAELLGSDRFRSKMRQDRHGNVAFPMFDEHGLCSYELKGPGLTMQAAGGIKGLWYSVPAADDTSLVVTEAPIDALAHAAVHGFKNARYISFCGRFTERQAGLIRRAIGKMRPGSELVAAVDNDEAGDRYVEQLAEILEAAHRPDVTLRVERPEGRGRDWGDEIRPGSEPPPLDEGGRPEPR